MKSFVVPSIILLAVLLFSLVGSLSFGYGYERGRVDKITAPERELAIHYLVVSRNTHQYYVEHPEACNGITGDSYFNEFQTIKYDWLISLLER